MKAILIGKDFKDLNKKVDELLVELKRERCLISNVNIQKSKAIITYNKLK